MTHERPAAIPPVVDPERWEDFDGFRETFRKIADAIEGALAVGSDGAP